MGVDKFLEAGGLSGMSAEILLLLIIHDRCGLFELIKQLTIVNLICAVYCLVLNLLILIITMKKRNLKPPLSTPLQ